MVTDVGRRIHAAQAYGGFTSIPALAAKINKAGFGEGTIRRIVAGSRPLEDHERQWLEEATGVPAEFFADGFTVAGPADDDVTAADNSEKLDALAGDLDDLREQIRESTDKVLVARIEIQTRVLQRLEQIDARITELDRRFGQVTQLDDTTVVPLVRRALEVVADEAASDGAQPQGRPRRHQGTGRAKTQPEAKRDPGERPR